MVPLLASYLVPLVGQITDQSFGTRSGPKCCPKSHSRISLLYGHSFGSTIGPTFGSKFGPEFGINFGPKLKIYPKFSPKFGPKFVSMFFYFSFL